MVGKGLLISQNKLSRSVPEAVKDVSSTYNLVGKKVELFGSRVINKNRSAVRTCVGFH